MIQPEAIHREIERQIGQKVEFRSVPYFDILQDLWATRVDFWSAGFGVTAILRDADRKLSLDEFGCRVVAPLVNRWQAEQKAAESA